MKLIAQALSTALKTVPLNYQVHVPKTESGGNPIIILHGLFGSKTTHRTVAKSLASKLKRKVYCPDLRNHGASPHVEPHDYPHLAADVERFIHDHQIRHPIIIGHSMGAKTAMAIPLRQPDLIKMLISVDNAPVTVPQNDASVFIKYISALKRALEQFKYTNIKDVDAELAKVEPNLVVRQFLETNLNRGSSGDVITSKVPLDILYDSVISGKVGAWPYDSTKSRWSKGPVLFIRGTDSAYVSDDIIADIGQFYPKFELRDIKAGHWVISEKPNEFIDLVVEFVERHED